MADPTPAVVNTPLPPQAPNPMAPVGTPQAAHVGPPVGIPSGPSNAELTNQIMQLQSQLQQLQGQQLDAELAQRDEKTYYHQTEGSTIVITRRGRNGEHIPEVVPFIGGKIVTTDPDIQDFLDQIVDMPGVPIYSKSAPEVNAALVAAAKEVVDLAARSIDKLGAEAGVAR